MPRASQLVAKLSKELRRYGDAIERYSRPRCLVRRVLAKVCRVPWVLEDGRPRWRVLPAAQRLEPRVITTNEWMVDDVGCAALAHGYGL